MGLSGDGGLEYSQKIIGWGCAACFPKRLPFLWPKSAIFPTLFIANLTKKFETLFMTWTDIKILFQTCVIIGSYFRPVLNYRRHNLWRPFVNFLFDNDENVASRLKNVPISRPEYKPHTLFYDQHRLKAMPILWPKRLKTVPSGAAHTYIAHIREYPSPPGVTGTEFPRPREFSFWSGRFILQVAGWKDLLIWV